MVPSSPKDTADEENGRQAEPDRDEPVAEGKASQEGQAQQEAPEIDAAQMREKWLRALADLDNLRKRTAGQIRISVLNERRAVLGAFLEVLDSLERALEAHEGEESEWVEGTKGIFMQMIKILRGFNVEPIDALGQPFDPNLHEAVTQIETQNHPANTVVEVLQVGYRFQDGSLLRPARVVVSCLPAAEEAEAGN